MRRTRAHTRRHRLLTVAVLLTIAAIGVGAGILAARGTGTGAHDGKGPHNNGGTSTTTGSTTSTTEPPPIGTIGTYAVATTSVTVTVPGASATESTLPTTVWYPKTATPSTSTSARRAYGPLRDLPLLVFSEGYEEPVASYGVLLDAWASAGYVVAGPTYPHTVPSDPTTLDRADIVHHPADLHAVLETLLAASTTPTSALHRMIDPAKIGLVGQSDGGDVSLAAVDSSCCRFTTPAIKALAVLSGAEYRHFGGEFFGSSTPQGPPILAVQGDRDTVNFPACSVQYYNAAPGPKYYLDLLGATHLVPYEQSGPYDQTVASVTTDFFDAELAGMPTALARMAHDGNVSGVATLSSSPTAPTPPGFCPTTTTPS